MRTIDPNAAESGANGPGAADPEPADGALSPPALLSVVALAGAGTMVIELGAVRLIAPWFGASSAVWTNVIGVVLAALALGYALGARLALGRRPSATLGRLLVLGGAVALALPRVARPVAELFMPEALPLHGAADALVWGSLAASVLLFFPAAAALGAAGPLAVEALQRLRGGSAGAAGGRVLAVSTFGSLAGTFGTTHLLVPRLGTAGAFTAAAAVLIVSGLVLALRSGARGALALLPLAALPALAWTLGPAPSRPAAQGERILADADSALQHLRVVETGEGANQVRTLRVNESLDSFQSIWTPTTGLLPPGHYYNHFALPYAWATRERKTPPDAWRTLIVGLGAGTTVRLLEGIIDPATELATVGIELDAKVVTLAREFFGLALPGTPGRIAVGGLDGRAALRFTRGVFDQIVVDAYANNMEIPPHIVTVEAFTEMRERLGEGGWIAVNVGGFGPEDPVLRGVAASLATAFWEDGGARAARVPFSRNWVLFARRGGRIPEPGSRSIGARGTQLVGDVGSLVAALEVDGAWLSFDAGDGTPLTDDRSPTEELQVRSVERATDALKQLEDRAADIAALDPSAPAPAADRAERAVRERLAAGDLSGALEACGDVRPGAIRRTLRAETTWRAGMPFEALETLLQKPEELAGYASGLRLLADVATSIGAGAVAAAATDRLAATVEVAIASGTLQAADWWRGEVTRLEEAARGGDLARSARSAAIWRAQAAAGVALVLFALVLGALALPGALGAGPRAMRASA